MTPWANYIITCVNYTEDGDRIDSVGVRTFNAAGQLGAATSWKRAKVAEKIGKDHTFVTATWNDKTKKWEKGAKVERYAVGGEWFIRTVGNNKAKDNLGELPDCP